MKIHALLFVLVTLMIFPASLLAGAPGEDRMTNALSDSLVYVESTLYSWETVYPWRRGNVSNAAGYGCAVGPYQVLVPAHNLTDASQVVLRRHGENEYISATIDVIDYDVNLCLLEIDPDDMDGPLKPVEFHTIGEKGASVGLYWLSADGEVKSGRGYIDRMDMTSSNTSYVSCINFIMGNVSQPGGNGHVYFQDGRAIGLGCWYTDDISEAGAIPAVIINHFLRLCHDDADGYAGFPDVGFSFTRLIDPALRQYLAMPEDMDSGVYVSDVVALGTGSQELQKHDVILTIDQTDIDAYGKFLHPRFKRIGLQHLLTRRDVGDTIEFHIWRDGKARTVRVRARAFDFDDMLIPYNEYDRQAEYMVIGGFVFRELSRKFLQAWGSNWTGRVDSHLYQYYLDKSLEPETDEEPREQIIVLTHVLPAEINLGYHDLRYLVVKSCNGRSIKSFEDIIAARLNPSGNFDVFELENDNPTIVIPRDQLPAANARIAQLYGIQKMQNIN